MKLSNVAKNEKFKDATFVARCFFKVIFFNLPSDLKSTLTAEV
jgi:hypothetical protein